MGDPSGQAEMCQAVHTENKSVLQDPPPAMSSLDTRLVNPVIN